MRMTCASLCNFLLKVDKSIMKHLSPWCKGKGCHGNDNKNGAMAAFQFRYSIEIPTQRESVLNMTSKDGGVISDNEFPHVVGKTKRGATCKRDRLISHNMHSVHGRSCRWLYLSKRALSEQIKFVEGSRRSRDGGSGSSCSRDGSRTWRYRYTGLRQQ